MTTIAKTKCGELRGRQEDGIHVFRGIPFAAPPVGELRWRPPAPPAPWTGVRDATEFGRTSFQASMEDAGESAEGPTAAIMGVDQPQSEDCLYLNVWTTALDGSRPVMVWIHGGGFAAGSGGEKAYSGSALCRRDVVVVTINYRLGPFGFCHLDRPTNGAIPATGNEGLLDQVAALAWVRDNIAGFGGDPGNVTIFGESSGSASVTSLMAMPAAKGLYHKAIAQSGGGHLTHPADDSVTWFTEPMLEKLGTRDAAALMTAAPEAIFQAFPNLMDAMAEGDLSTLGRYPGPVADGKVLATAPEEAMAGGSAAGVPFLSGNTRDEMSMFIDMLGELTFEGLAEMLAPRLPAPLTAAGLIETYRTARAARGARVDAPSIGAAIAADKYEFVPTSRMLDAQRAHAPVFRYVFDWMTPYGDGKQGAHHGLDVGLVFGVHRLEGLGEIFGRGPAADALADAMMDAWTAFARTGNPSSPGLGEWPDYDPESRPTMMIGPNVHVARDPMGAERRAWDDVPSTSPAMKTIF